MAIASCVGRCRRGAPRPGSLHHLDGDGGIAKCAGEVGLVRGHALDGARHGDAVGVIAYGDDPGQRHHVRHVLTSGHGVAAFPGQGEVSLGLVGELISKSTFNETDFEEIRQEMQVDLENQMKNTSAMAYAEFLRTIFDTEHPLYPVPLDEKLRALEALAVEDVISFYNAAYVPQQFILVAVGDIDHEKLEIMTADAFPSQPSRENDFKWRTTVRQKKAVQKLIPIPEKNNLDIYLGRELPINRLHTDYLPLSFAFYVFGGDHSARLAQQIRDTYGLSYSITARLGGMNHELEGYWNVHMISIPQNYREAIDRTVEEVKRFAGGITSEELSGVRVPSWGVSRSGCPLHRV